jgi:hypothetical protein
VKNTITAFVFILFIQTGFSQIDETKTDMLVKYTFENEIISSRFLKDYFSIVKNINKKSNLSDLDKSVALYDNNLMYIGDFVSFHPDLKKYYDELENYWNLYRISLFDFENNDYKTVLSKNENLQKLQLALKNKIFEKQPISKKKKHTLEKILKIKDNVKELTIAYVKYILTENNKKPIKSNLLDYDLSKVEKNIKKLSKNKDTQNEMKDLKSLLNKIKILFETNIYQPKSFLTDLNIFSIKSYNTVMKLFENCKKIN